MSLLYYALRECVSQLSFGMICCLTLIHVNANLLPLLDMQQGVIAISIFMAVVKWLILSAVGLRCTQENNSRWGGNYCDVGENMRADDMRWLIKPEQRACVRVHRQGKPCLHLQLHKRHIFTVKLRSKPDVGMFSGSNFLPRCPVFTSGLETASSVYASKNEGRGTEVFAVVCRDCKVSATHCK